jgi:hypothetical protein
MCISIKVGVKRLDERPAMVITSGTYLPPPRASLGPAPCFLVVRKMSLEACVEGAECLW